MCSWCMRFVTFMYIIDNFRYKLYSGEPFITYMYIGLLYMFKMYAGLLR